MQYISTRGEAPALGFSDTLLAGLARDGGLYLPEEWPHFGAAEIRALRGLSYPEMAIRLLTPFTGSEIETKTFSKIVHEAYATFRHRAVCPILKWPSGF
jgi:threonine synthase